MDRGVLADHLQSHRFWLTDAGPFELGGLPVLSPLYGFSAITAPELNLEMQTIQEGNGPQRSVVKHANVSPITLSRGASLGDGDFYRWVQSAHYGLLGGRVLGSGRRLAGIPLTPRRNLLLLQFFPRSPFPLEFTAAAGGVAIAALLGAAGASAGIASAAGFGIAGAMLGSGPSLVHLPARAWILRGCIPSRYKTGTDFDATSAEVSIMELDLAVEDFEEVSL